MNLQTKLELQITPTVDNTVSPYCLILDKEDDHSPDYVILSEGSLSDMWIVARSIKALNAGDMSIVLQDSHGGVITSE